MPTIEPWPLLEAQQGIWLADRASADPTDLLTEAETFLPASVDPKLFAEAGDLAVHDIEILRLRVGGAALQWTAPPTDRPTPMAVVDLSAASDPAAAAQAWRAGARRRPIDPSRGAPFRWTLLRLAPDRLIWHQTYHHVAADATGRYLVARHVAATYDALAQGAERPAAPSCPSLREVAAVEAEYLASARYRDDAAWCLAQCAEPPQALDLSRLRVRGDAGLASHRARFRLDCELAATLRDRSRLLGLSLPQLLCLAWAGLLARLACQDDVLVGLQLAARRPGARMVPVMLTNQVPLRLHLPAEATLGAFGSTIGERTRAALRHQYYPQTHLNRALARSVTTPDLFEIGFNAWSEPAPLTIAGWAMATRNLSHGPTPGLSLSVEDAADGGLMLDLDANRGRFGADDAERLLGRLAMLLRALAGAAPSSRFADLPIMAEAETGQVTGAFAGSGPAPKRTTLAAILATQTMLRPLATALIAVDATLTYAELHARAMDVVRLLRDRGVRPGEVVAIALPRRADLVVALLACWHGGIAACPLDPAHPPDRLAHMLATAACRLVIGERILGDFLCEVPVLTLDGLMPAAGMSPPEAADVAPEAIAYIAFTSGSTGRPKGVAITQAAIAAHIQALREHLPMRPGEAMLGATTATFDVGMADILLPLTSGATLVLLDDLAMRDPLRIGAFARAHPHCVLQATPSTWRTLPLESMPPTLRAVIGGEPFPEELRARLARFRDVYNVYGPTETTVWASLSRVDCAAPPATRVTIGRPLAGYWFRILDAADRPAPIGAVGELCIGGEAVADGYLAEPELTEGAFVCDGSGRMYRTGDLAWWRPDGTVDLLGRRDRQIKIAGHRIEPGEIEQALLALDGIREVAVTAHGAPSRLVAHVVARDGAGAPDEAAFRRHLAGRLPPRLMPSDFVFLARLPRTRNGKLDRLALTPPAAVPPARRPAAPPASALEALLCRRFAAATGNVDIGRDDDFFAIGGDSLAAMVFLTEFSQDGYNLPLPTLLERRTPAALAAWLSERGLAESGHAEPPDRPVLFLLPGRGGDSPDLAELRIACADRLPIVLLDYPDWAALLAPGFDMAALVVDLARRLERTSPSGPVLVAGYSMGGVIAAALAECLRGRGRAIAGLLILDTMMIASSPRFAQPIVRKMPSLIMEARDAVRRGEVAPLLGRVVGGRLARARRVRVLRVLARLRGLRLPARQRYWLAFHVAGTLQGRLAEPWRGHVFDLQGVPVVLLRAAGRSDGEARDLGWRRQGCVLRVIDVAGDHLSLLREEGPGSARAELPSVATTLLEEARTNGSTMGRQSPEQEPEPEDSRLHWGLAHQAGQPQCGYP